MGVSAAGKPNKRRTAGRLVEALVRAVLVVGGLVPLRFAESRYLAWSRENAAAFRIQLGGWVLWVGLMALAGLAFGLAGWMPWGRMRYRWTHALLVGVVPLVMLAHFAIVATHWFSLPRWLWGRPPYFWTDVGPQFALAVLLGIAVASGFASHRDRSRPLLDLSQYPEEDRLRHVVLLEVAKQFGEAPSPFVGFKLTDTFDTLPVGEGEGLEHERANPRRIGR